MGPDESLDLFSPASTPATGAVAGIDPRAPLAERMRPQRLDDVVGQSELLAAGSPLRSLVVAERLPSLILWGPPGSGKTTLARLLAARSDTHLAALSAVAAGVKEIREVVAEARRQRRGGIDTILFLDEIHRLNRAQQDVLLPHVEAGTVTLVGATTENPSFEVNAPLLSRCSVFRLERLDEATLAGLVERAVADSERGLGSSGLVLTREALLAIAAAADGDARRALGLLEAAAAIHGSSAQRSQPLSPETVRDAAGRRLLLYDRDREEHYNIISAFIKSMRASDPDAALYYLARMLEAGEDALFIARRLVIFASEDVGNADPHALPLATATHVALERIGLPEGRIPLAQTTTYLACALKSNRAYAALGRAQAAVEAGGSLPVPMHLRNAATPLMRSEGYGVDYRNPHDEPDSFVEARNLPDGLADTDFYRPAEVGAESAIAGRLASWRKRRKPRNT